MTGRIKVDRIEVSRTGKRSHAAKLETLARKQVRRIKYATATTGGK